MEQNHQPRNSQEERGIIEIQDETRNESEEPKKGLSPKAKKEIREWVISLGAALLVVVLLRSFLFTIIRVDGGSMSDTLFDNDRLFVSVLDVKRGGPNRFDVVICEYPNRSDQFVKRVIGMPGDTIMVRRGVLYVNDEVYEEPYLTDARTVKFDRGSNNFGPIVIPDGKYFVMGDNRDDSNDSRRVGLIDEDMMIGTVKYIIWPLDRIGEVAGSEEYDR